jgi:voltage-gated sodium channel
MQSQATAAQAKQKHDLEELAEEKERLLHEEIEGLRRDIGELKKMVAAQYPPVGDPRTAREKLG